MESWEGRNSLPTFSLREISLEETLSLISKLGKSSSFGRDNLDANSLKCVKDYIAPPLNNIINLSILKQQYIMKWKQSRVIPILKSSDSSRLSPSSYRPISLLPVMSKLVERAVLLQLLRHFETHGLLHHNGHAYRANHSTSTAMMQVMDGIYTATDSNMITQLMALDQSAAFDCVSHSILLDKLKLYKCSQTTLEWMKQYLQHRSQQVCIGRHQQSLVQGGTPGIHSGTLPVLGVY